MVDSNNNVIAVRFMSAGTTIMKADEAKGYDLADLGEMADLKLALNDKGEVVETQVSHRYPVFG